MINQNNFLQKILEYAIEKYGEKLNELFQKYGDDFPEKDWELPEQTWKNNFITWFLCEKVLPETGKTIAEEFAENTPELDPEMKENFRQMKNPIRSEFLVISREGQILEVKDMKHKNAYYTIRLHIKSPIYPTSVIIGRIHPFGKYYHIAGVFKIAHPSFIFDPDVLMSYFMKEKMNLVESIQLKPNSSFQSILMKYPSHWIDWMCKHYNVKERFKKEKVLAIVNKILNDLPQIVSQLPETSKEILIYCLKNDGIAKYNLILKKFNSDDDTDFFWEKDFTSPLGILRQKGLVIVGKMMFGSKQFKVAFIPFEIREKLKYVLLPQK